MKLEAAQRLLLADGEWFDALTDELKEQYVEEHPDSKYAKGWKHRGAKPEPSTKQLTDKGRGSQTSLVPKHPGGTPKARKDITKLPAPAQKFVKSGGTKSGSKSRKAVGKVVKAHAAEIAKKTLRDNKNLAISIASLPKILQDRGSAKDWKGVAKLGVAKLGVTVLASVSVAGALGVSGPAGFLTFMALKHLAAPALFSLVRKSVHAKPHVADDVHIHKVASKGWKATGNKGISPYGYWKDNETWVSETRDEWESKYDAREGNSGRIPKKKHAALIIAADEADPGEQLLQSIIETFADFAADGDVPDDAWDAAVEEMAAKQQA